MFNFLGNVLSGVAGFFGAKHSADANAKAARLADIQAREQLAATKELNARNIAFQENANRLMLADKAQDRAMQEEFAKSGIQWKVADAEKAGIHPMYALGAQGASYSPSGVQVGTPGLAAEFASSNAPEYLAREGQDIGRAIQATRSLLDRQNAMESTVNGLKLSNMGLQNELLSAQIAKLRGQVGPPMPSGSLPSTGPLPPIKEDSSQEERPPLQFAGRRIQTDPRTSNFDSFSKRWGDEGLPQWLVAPAIMYRDMQATTGEVGVWDAIKWIDAATSIGEMPQLPSPSEIRKGMPSWHPR